MVKEKNETTEEAEKTAESFATKVNDQKNTISEEDAEKRIREILGIPKEEKKKK